MSHHPIRRILAVCAIALLGAAIPLRAQRVEVKLGGGLAVPSGGAGEFRAPGLFATVSAGYPLGGPWRVRADAEWARLEGEGAPEGAQGGVYGDLRAYGLSVNAILGGEGALAPYLLLGAGAYSLRSPGGSDSGITAGLNAGAGVNVTLAPRVRPYVEVRATVHATDYGSRELSSTVYWPLIVGLRL